MRSLFVQPDVLFGWFDTLLAFLLLVLSVILFLRHKRGYMTPVLFAGLFLFPLQFSIWFLPARVQLSETFGINLLQMVYLLFVELCLLISLLLSRR
jgi:hypothetical protein